MCLFILSTVFVYTFIAWLHNIKTWLTFLLILIIKCSFPFVRIICFCTEWGNHTSWLTLHDFKNSYTCPWTDLHCSTWVLLCYLTIVIKKCRNIEKRGVDRNKINSRFSNHRKNYPWFQKKIKKNSLEKLI